MASVETEVEEDQHLQTSRLVVTCPEETFSWGRGTQSCHRLEVFHVYFWLLRLFKVLEIKTSASYTAKQVLYHRAIPPYSTIVPPPHTHTLHLPIL